MDREISTAERNKNGVKRLMPIALAAILLVGGYFGVRELLTKQGDRRDFHIVSVERGSIKNTLAASGRVVAASERVINAPVTTEVEKVYLSTGAEVKSGDNILQLDKELTALEYDKLQDELSLRRNNIDKLKLQFDKNLRELDYDNQIKGLQVSQLTAQLKDKKHLQNVGGATAEEVEAADLLLKISQIEKQKIENELNYRRSVNSTEKANLQLEYDIQSKRLTELRKKLSETLVKAPESGVITWINEDIGKTVNVGEPLVKIANLSSYKIEGSTSDRNSKKIQIGLPVQVKIGKEVLMGEVVRVLPEVINNTVKFDVMLAEANHKLLRPNLKTELSLVTNEKSNVLKVKRGAALHGAKTQYFYKVNGDTAEKVRVTKGLVSAEHVEIESGLQEGDQIIISDVKDYDHLDAFTFKSKK